MSRADKKQWTTTTHLSPDTKTVNAQKMSLSLPHSIPKNRFHQQPPPATTFSKETLDVFGNSSLQHRSHEALESPKLSQISHSLLSGTQQLNFPILYEEEANNSTEQRQKTENQREKRKTNGATDPRRIPCELSFFLFHRICILHRSQNFRKFSLLFRAAFTHGTFTLSKVAFKRA